VHSLSKRTALYGTYSRIDNKGNQNFVVLSGGPTLPGGTKSQSVELGLRHSF
jgi:predicted porin